MTNVSQLRTIVRIGFTFSGFEGEQDAASDLRGIFNSLKTGSKLFPLRIAKVVMPCAGGDNKRIVIYLSILEDNAPIGYIDVSCLCQQHLDIALTFKDSA